MKPRLLLLIAGLASPGTGLAGDSSAVVIEHANVIDGVSSEPRRDVTVVLVGGKIASVSTSPAVAPKDAKRINLAGRWLLPGLIDAHIHPTNAKVAQGFLAVNGVTTGRSMGAWSYADVELRERHRKGDATIPDILAAGYAITSRIGSLDAVASFSEHPELADLRPGKLTVAGMERVVQANLSHGLDVLKVMVTVSITSPDPLERRVSDELLIAAVQVARKAGVPVAAHVYGDSGILAAINAGVSTIEHGVWVADATLELMKEKQVLFSPLVVGLKKPERHQAARDAVRRAYKMGVKLLVGTDGQQIGDVIVALGEIGMTPMEAIQAATSRNAEALGISQRTGSVQAGLEADLIAVEASPLEDLRALSKIALVVNDGIVVTNQLATK